jgi:hypothetical protein
MRNFKKLVILILIQILIQFPSLVASACTQPESHFSGQIYRVIKLPEQHKCLVQINFSEINETSKCSLKLDQLQNQYIQLQGPRCDLKMDQAISGVIIRSGGKFILSSKS